MTKGALQNRYASDRVVGELIEETKSHFRFRKSGGYTSEFAKRNWYFIRESTPNISTAEEARMTQPNPTPISPLLVKVGDDVSITMRGKVTSDWDGGLRILTASGRATTFTRRDLDDLDTTISRHAKPVPPIPWRPGTIIEDADKKRFILLGYGRRSSWYEAETGKHVGRDTIEERWATGQMSVVYQPPSIIGF